ncbi:hypothetical protein Fcan01_18939 [Folsomia candida]|uniref:Uncharacterized protein n=1 Tax=Folsomia candida TaxID=158441 RepID=A0A226DLK9_FOLCA|nr:hypothetical protein Fcan01_18939 [Folsomia candida]
MITYGISLILLFAQYTQPHQECHFVTRYYNISNIVDAWIGYFSEKKPNSSFFTTATMLSSSGARNFSKVYKKLIRFGSDCEAVVIYDFTYHTQDDMASIFKPIYNSVTGIFLLMWSKPGKPSIYYHNWKVQPSLIYIFSPGERFPNFYFSKSRLEGQDYEKIPLSISTLDVLTRKWRPVENQKWRPVLVLQQDENCLPTKTIFNYRKSAKPCKTDTRLIHFVAGRLNFTLMTPADPLASTVRTGLIVLNVNPSRNDSEVTFTEFMNNYYKDVQIDVIYCQKYSRLKRSFSVWLSPYGKLVWVFLLGSIIALALAGKGLGDGKLLFNEMYLLLSIIFRQPCRTIPARYLLFTLLGIVIPSVYESFITGNLISPNIPDRIRNVGEFFRLHIHRGIFGYMVTERDDYNPFHNDASIAEDFKKHGVRDKLNLFSHVNDELELSDYYYEYLVGEDGTDVPVGLASSGDAWVNGCLLNYYKYVIERKNESGGYSYSCNSFPIGGKTPTLAIYAVEFLHTAHIVHLSAMEGGFLSIWNSLQKVWLGRRGQEHANMLGGNSSSISDEDVLSQSLVTLKNLQTFFIMWTVLIGCSFVVCIIYWLKSLIMGCVVFRIVHRLYV